MKRTLLFLLLAPPLFGQQIDSSQVKLKTGGGLAGDSASKLTVAIPYASSAPGSPLTGAVWCDTTATPCTLKQYTGSTWVQMQLNAAVQTVTSADAFPAAPVDGEMVYIRTPPTLMVYDGTAARWNRVGGAITRAIVTALPNLNDVYTAAVIASPGAATAALSGTAGSTANGNYSYKVTCRNDAGGETDGGTVSNTVTVTGGPKSVDLSAIPTCGTGATNRNIYRSKVNQQAAGPWYYVKHLSDNTTTTANDGLADASLLLLVPTINFSAALPTGWVTVNRSANTDTGGCGGTGATRNSMACYGGVTGWRTANTRTTDLTIRGSRDISAYAGRNYTVQARLKQISTNGDSSLAVRDPHFFGVRNGTDDFQSRITMGLGTGQFTGPISSSNRPQFSYGFRDPPLANGVSAVTCGNPYPQLDALPIYVRWVRRFGSGIFFVSSNAVNWQPAWVCTGTSVTAPQCAWGATWGMKMDIVELPFIATYITDFPNGGWIEIDQFSLIQE